ncbi:MAG: adenosylcobinamide kinase/adenosylcobinamide-phosphate guanylyltransferase [Halocynthiibacter sp.]|jgi:adenosylcobinamide kinase/adenosylcobinamide-phosphate guanylyltransferase
MFPALTLVLGGAASGKSDLAEKLCVSSDLPLVYLATAQAHDEEMRTKIARHRTDRGTNWQTIEAPLHVNEALLELEAPGSIILLDCATMWLSNHLLAESDLLNEQQKLLEALESCSAPVVIVSNEVGLSIVPDNALARAFRNAQGGLNRALAAQADCVIGVMAGLPFALKGALPEALK